MTSISMSRWGLVASSDDLAARHGSAWPLARTLSSLESRREGLQNGSRRSRRLWQLRVRKPRLRLSVLSYSYDKRRPQLRYLS